MKKLSARVTYYSVQDIERWENEYQVRYHERHGRPFYPSFGYAVVSRDNVADAAEFDPRKSVGDGEAYEHRHKEPSSFIQLYFPCVHSIRNEFRRHPLNAAMVNLEVSNSIRAEMQKRTRYTGPGNVR